MIIVGYFTQSQMQQQYSDKSHSSSTLYPLELNLPWFYLPKVPPTMRMVHDDKAMTVNIFLHQQYIVYLAEWKIWKSLIELTRTKFSRIGYSWLSNRLDFSIKVYLLFLFFKHKGIFFV